jgi:hypothetical protein
MRVTDSAMRLQLQSMLEEALRLTTLPGEDQGRVYFFRRLQMPAVDSRMSPGRWVASCSEHLLKVSYSAQYAGDRRAQASAAVYFQDHHEPRRTLLRRMLAGENPREWFWPQATGVACELPPPVRLEHILEQWRVQPASWAGVARELLPLLDDRAATKLLELLRPVAAERWLAGLSTVRSRSPVELSVPELRSHTRELLRELSLRFPEEDPRVLFFSVLAVLESTPAAAQDAALPALAQLSLENLYTASPVVRDQRGRLLNSQKDNKREKLAGIKQEESTTSARPEISMRIEHRTRFAGLYFLLHVLRHIGIDQALQANPSLVLTHFVSRVLLRLAAAAGVAADDPVLLPLLEDVAEFKGAPADSLVPPASLSRLKRLRPGPELTERLWSVAVRRWCQKHAHMRMGEVVARQGRMYARPTEIDIIMPMSAVDIRIRRCGLDLDPGYVPWFGRVIHFHYHTEPQP